MVLSHHAASEKAVLTCDVMLPSTYSFIQRSSETCYSTFVHVCSGSAVITANDFESDGRPGSNPEWGQIYYEASIIEHRAYPSLHPSGVVHWMPEQLNMKAVTGHASWLVVAALRCVRPHFQWSHLSYATEIKSIRLHDSIVMASPLDSISYSTLHYITLHYITLHYITLHYITLHYITLHYITLHHITSLHITSHHITSHHITSHRIASHRITLQCLALHCIALHYITSHHITSHHITSHHITSHHITWNYIT